MAKRSKVGKFFTPKTVISGIVILIAILVQMSLFLMIQMKLIHDPVFFLLSQKDIF
jgi:hypothetical protein